MVAMELEACGVHAARRDILLGSSIAVLLEDRPLLASALRAAGMRHPGLVISAQRNRRTVKRVAARELDFDDLSDASWLRLALYDDSRADGSDSSREDVDRSLVIYIVAHDARVNRYLALHWRAELVDWTSLFRERERTSHPATSPVAGGVVRHLAAPVDVVYTWVNYADSKWKKQYDLYRQTAEIHNKSSANPERYLDRDELRYSLRSLWMFAPFVRHIYVVTANQRPSWLNESPMVSVVSHKEIFPRKALLPTFNSRAIEACLHRIKDLSENFVYFNDDFFLGREVSEEDFFTVAGLAKSRLSPSWYIYEGAPEQSAIPTDWGAYNSNQLLERSFSVTFDRRLMHAPYVLKRSVMLEIERRYRREVRKIRASRFRYAGDLSIPSMFGQYYAIATRRAVEWETPANDYVYLDTGRENSIPRYSRILDKRPKFFCLNSTRYREIDAQKQVDLMRNVLERLFPAPAPWEKV